MTPLSEESKKRLTEFLGEKWWEHAEEVMLRSYDESHNRDFSPDDWQSLGDLKKKLVETHQWYDFYLFARGKIRNSELDQIYNSYETGFVNWLINPAIFIPLVDEFLKEKESHET